MARRVQQRNPVAATQQRCQAKQKPLAVAVLIDTKDHREGEERVCRDWCNAIATSTSRPAAKQTSESAVARKPDHREITMPSSQSASTRTWDPSFPISGCSLETRTSFKYSVGSQPDDAQCSMPHVVLPALRQGLQTANGKLQTANGHCTCSCSCSCSCSSFSSSVGRRAVKSPAQHMSQSAYQTTLGRPVTAVDPHTHRPRATSCCHPISSRLRSMLPVSCITTAPWLQINFLPSCLTEPLPARPSILSSSGNTQ